MNLKYFTLSEFNCPCGKEECKGDKMNKDFLEMLDDARDIASIPFKINSGMRCRKHNEDLKKRGFKASSKSSHLKGLAADISAKDSSTRWTIINSLLLAGFTRLGIASTFIHVDLDSDKQQEVIWTY
mgnify:CR=1 FL=1